MNPQKSSSATWALILIAVALAGAGVSYHMTLQSRFASIEQKLDQNSLALQQYQLAEESTASSKLDALNNLSKEVDALQASLEPLGKTTKEQTDSLSAIQKQIVTLQQSQQAQQDAEKKLADYAAQLDKIKHDIQVQPASAPAPVPATTITPVVSAPPVTPASTPTPVTTTHASISHVALPLPPRVDNAVDIRPDQASDVVTDSSVRALPVALPVTAPVALSSSESNALP